MRTAEETAVLLAVMLKRSGETRARISGKTIRKISDRRHIRAAFINMLTQHLDDLGLNMSELERGGYGLVRASVLEGAKTITAKNYLREDLKKLKKDKGHFKDVLKEIEDDLATDDDDDE